MIEKGRLRPSFFIFIPLMKKTLVVGASPNPDRYSYKATERLDAHGHEVFPFGIRKGAIGSNQIQLNWPDSMGFHTITLYMNPARQAEHIPAIIKLQPERVIFNPGTENPEFQATLDREGIEWIEACTLVMLSIGNY